MWTFENKRNALREQLLLAPESNPSEFVRRYLAQKQSKDRVDPVSRLKSLRFKPPSLANRAQRLFAG